MFRPIASFGCEIFIKEDEIRYPYPIKKSAAIIINAARYTPWLSTRRSPLIASLAAFIIYELSIIFICFADVALSFGILYIRY